jgi:Ca2+-binding RTX toxin-like protein
MRSFFSSRKSNRRSNTKPAAAPHGGAPLLETLEIRQLMSATLTDGTLLVQGTSMKDALDLSSTPSVVSVMQKTNGVTTIKSFEFARVQKVVVYGWGGNDRITMGNLAKAVTAFGGDGDDFIEGGTAADKIFGGNGADTLYGWKGNDLVEGDAGNDYVNGSWDHDVVRGGSGNDTVEGFYGDDRVGGGTGNDVVNGGAGADNLFGDDGSDILDGGAGADVMYGGTGNDQLYGRDGADKLYGEEGSDHLDGGAAFDMMFGGNGDDYFYAKDGGLDYSDGGTGWDRIKRDSPSWFDQKVNIEEAYY